MVEIVRSRVRLSVVTAEERFPEALRADGSIEDVDATAACVRSLLSRQTFRSAVATAAVPASACSLRRVSVVARGRRDLERQVAEEIERLDLGGVQEWSIDWSPVSGGSADARVDVLIAAIPTDVVRSYVECLREADLVPAAIDVDVVALDRLVPSLDDIEDRVVAMIEVDQERCLVNVIRHGKAAFHASLTPPRAGAAGRSSAAELAEAIHEVLGFFWSGSGEESLFSVRLCGAGASHGDLVEAIESRLRVPTSKFDPFAVFGGVANPFPSEATAEPADWALALALGLRSMTSR